MPTLKERMLEKAEYGAKEALKKYEEYLRLERNIAEMPGLEVECSEEDVTITLLSYGSVVAMCQSPGKAQEMANCLSIELGIEMRKDFDPRDGKHSYYGSVGSSSFYFSIYGTPPESCEVEWIEEEELVTRRKAVIRCE